MSPAPRGRRRRRDERGGIAVFVAVTTTLLLLVSALAVDLGQQRVGRRDMQALADVVALDMARLLQGRTTAQVLADPAWSQELARSVARNPETLGDPPQVTAVLGRLDKTTGAFTATTGTQVPNAVRVTARTEVQFSIMPGEGGATRTAVAAADPTACFSLGSFAVRATSGDSPLLNALIADGLNASVLSYEGLADARISLLGLATELGAGTVDELVSLPGLTVNRFFVAAANVLQREGGSTADVQALRALSTSIGALPNITVAQLLQLAPGADAALGASLNVLDLVATTAFVANGDAFLSIPATTVSLPGLANVSARLKVIEPLQTACGRPGEATARTAQIRLELSAAVSSLNLGVAEASASVSLAVDVAPAVGALTATSCGAAAAPSAAAPDRLSVAVTGGLVASQIDLPVRVTILGIPIELLARLSLTPSGAPATLNLVLSSMAAYGTPVSTGNTGLQVPNTNTDVDVTSPAVLGLVVRLALAPVLETVSDVLLPTVAATLNTGLIAPLLRLLGVKVGGADVYGVPRPDCSTPALRG